MRPTTRILGLAMLLAAVVYFFFPTWKLATVGVLPRTAANSIICSSVGASLGLFLGDTATSLQPLDLLGVQGPASWPVCNPIFTAGGLKSYNGIAGPSFFQFEGRLFMFFEALACQNQRRSIGVAESTDDGVTWKSLGLLLSSNGQDILRRPRVFTYNNEIFMVTDSRHGVKLIRCVKFPASWHMNATLTTDPLRGISIMKAPAPKGVELAEEKTWLMVGSLSTSFVSSSSSSSSLGRRGANLNSNNNTNKNANSDGVDLPREDDMIAVYTAASPFGPWKQHSQSPFRVHAASPGGGLAILPKSALHDTDNPRKELIIRLGRSCTGGPSGPSTCSDVVASTFDFTEDTLHEAPLSLPPHQSFLGERVWRQGDGWDGGERAEATVAALPSGKVAAIVLGKPTRRHIRPWYAFVLESTVLLLHMAVVGCVVCLVAMIILKNRGLRIWKMGVRGFGIQYSSNGGSSRSNSNSGYIIPTRRGGGGVNTSTSTSPHGIHGTTSSGGSGASLLPGGFTPKTSLAIQRLQAEERGEVHHQPLSPRGRAVLTSRAAARVVCGGGEGSASTSASAAPEADLAARFAAFASMPSSSSSPILSSSSSSSPTGHHLSLNTNSRNNNHNHTTTASSLSNNSSNKNNNLRLRRGYQFKLAIRGAIQRGAIRLLEATPRQMVSFFTAFFAISSVAFAVGRVHTLLYPFWAPAPALNVGGQYSRFTLLVMSYESRRSLLEGYIRNYQECPSVGEILIVWNQHKEEDEKFKKNPPDPLRDYPWAAVPIRVRAHANNSLTNRYLPDDQLRYRGVLSLDDDLRVPCVDIEQAFAKWRMSPSSLTGYVARLAEVSTTPRYQTEPEAVAKGWYNLILTGAAFMDSRNAFSAYWSNSKSMQKARNIVDSLHNCDDILMNFVVANITEPRTTSKKGKKQGSVLFVRPSRRLDVSWWSGVGLSHSVGHFLDDAEQCLIEFEKLFGRWPLRAEEFDWEESKGQGKGGGKPKCRKGRSHLDCSYLS